jgi:hypothetical protein
VGTDVVSPLPVAEVLAYSDLEPSLFDLMLAAGGVVLENARHAATYGTLSSVPTIAVAAPPTIAVAAITTVEAVEAAIIGVCVGCSDIRRVVAVASGVSRRIDNAAG